MFMTISVLVQAVNDTAKWETQGFRVSYPSLDRELYVGGYYVRLLLKALEDDKNPYKVSRISDFPGGGM